MLDMLLKAGKIASNRIDRRTFYLGAVGIRSDGAIVSARNEGSNVPIPSGHAEARLSRKLDYNAIVFVARIAQLKSDNPCFAMAKPCKSCMGFLRAKRVKRVYWTVSDRQFDYLDFKYD